MAIIAPEVNPDPIRPPRLQPQANVETFGGGPGLEQIGQQTGKLASVAGEAATSEIIRADQMAVEEAVGSKLSPALTKLIYDPENGALARINQSTDMKSALKVHDETIKAYNDIAKKIASGLSGENQIGAFTKHAFTYGDSLNRTIMAHADQHLKQQDEKSFNSFVDNSIAQGALSYGDTRNRIRLLNMMDNHANEFAKRNGLDEEQATDMKSRIFSNFHDRVIGQMLSDQQDMGAKKYFDANKDQITVPAIREKVQKALEEGSYRGESQRSADSIWKNTDGNLQAAYSQADKETDPELRDRIHQRLKEMDNDVKEARRSDQDNAYYDASKIIGKAVQSGSIKGEASLMDTVGPDRWIRMTPTQQDSLKRLWLNDQNSDQVWTSYNLMSPTDKASQNQSDFETDVLSRLDKSHRDKAMSMRNAALGNRVTSTTDHEQARMIEKSAQQTGIIPGLDPGKSATKLKGDAAAQYGAFQEQVLTAISDFERNELGGRRRASQQEVQKIVDQKVIDYLSSSKPSFFTSVGRSLGLSVKPTVNFNDIPDDARENILFKARQLGKSVTKEQIENAYGAYQKKDLKGVIQALQ